MWGWWLTLRKCFGTNREQSPPPELPDGAHAVPGAEEEAPADEVQIVVEPASPRPAGSHDGRPPLPSILDDTVPSPQLKGAAGVAAMRASPLLQARTLTSRPQGRSHSPVQHSPAGGRPPAAAQPAAGKSAAGLVRRPSSAAKGQATVVRQSRLAVSTPAQPRVVSAEERPLAVHNTPFDIRLERQLRQDGGAAVGPSSVARRPAARHEWTAPVLLEEAAATPPSASATDRAEHGGEGLGSAAPAGKENADSPGRRKASGSGSVAAALRPQLQVLLPDFGGLPPAGQLLTPSPSTHPCFVLEAHNSFGTPEVVGLANRVSRYREDRTLRIHDTPFEERVERFMQTEHEWKQKQRLSASGGSGRA